MWVRTYPLDHQKHDLTWAVEGITNNMLIWVTDGSYNTDKAVDLCGVGWILFCTATGKRLTGLCWERSNAASLYCAKMLGLCALHLFTRALLEYYKITKWRATVCCNNQRALECSTYHRQRINQAPNVLTSDKASRPQNTPLQGASSTSMSTDTWTTTSCGTS